MNEPSAPLSELTQLSIIIVTWNGDDLLEHCLSSLATTCKALPEIIIVDNADCPSTRLIVQKYPNANYVPSSKNLGFAGGNNLGLQYCNRQFVALLNNDTFIEEDPFSRLISYLKEHSNVGAVQGTLIMPLRRNRPDACGISMTKYGFVFERLFPNMNSEGVTTPIPVFAAKGALTMFARELPAKVGGLFHDFYFNNSEDVDFGARIWLAGYEVHYVPTPPVQHLCGQTVTRLERSEREQKNLFNLMFTWLTVLSPLNSMRAICGWIIWNLLSGIGHYVHTGESSLIITTLNVLKELYQQQRLIKSTRIEVQRHRRTTDWNIFNRVAARKPFSWYWRSFRGDVIYET